MWIQSEFEPSSSHLIDEHKVSPISNYGAGIHNSKIVVYCTVHRLALLGGLMLSVPSDCPSLVPPDSSPAGAEALHAVWSGDQKIRVDGTCCWRPSLRSHPSFRAWWVIKVRIMIIWSELGYPVSLMIIWSTKSSVRVAHFFSVIKARFVFPHYSARCIKLYSPLPYGIR